MSGGEYNYVTFQIQDFARSLNGVSTDPRRASFQKLLFLVATAAHDIEWVDSYDKVPGDEHESIDACFAFLGNSPEMIKKAHAYDALEKLLREFLKNEHP